MSEIELTVYVLYPLVVVLAVVVFFACLSLSGARDQIRQLQADRHFMARDIARLEKLVDGVPKPPDNRLSIEVFGGEIFYTRTKD